MSWEMASAVKIQVMIEGLNEKKYSGRPTIEDLPEPQRSEAWGWFSHFISRRRAEGKATPQTTQAILMGQAKRLARMTPEERSRLGRKMRATLGGYAVQQKYREEGRTGDKHPAHKAARISAVRRKQKKLKREEAEFRQRLELPPPTRSKWLDIG